MHGISVVHRWVNMRPLNRTQPTNLQLYYNQSTNHSPWFGVMGPQKILLPRAPISVDWYLLLRNHFYCFTYAMYYFTYNNLFSTSVPLYETFRIQTTKTLQPCFEKVSFKVFFLEGENVKKLS